MACFSRPSALLLATLVAIPALARAQQAARPRAPGAAVTSPAGALGERMVGTWVGVLKEAALRLALTVRRDSVGRLTGIMKSIDQDGVEIPASIEVRGDTLSFAIPSQHITYTGVLAPSGDTLAGTFVQGQSVPLILVRGGTVTAPARPQMPKPPFPYLTEEVTVPSAPGVRLAGTVVLPPGKGPFPAVVFVTGSGPQDRDEAVMGHRPFLVIADYLARHGIASLRCDDRGFAKSTGSFDAATSADFAVDAEAAVRFLRKVKGVAPDRVGILGHSEGGLIGPMVAARTQDVAFLVLLAGPGLPGDSLSLLQVRSRVEVQGAPPAQVQAALETNRRLLRAVAGARDSADAAARVEAAKQEVLAGLPEDKRSAAATRMGASIPQLLAPWMRFFLGYDPRGALRRVRVPVLALGGSLDVQVPARENLPEIEAALRDGGDKDYRVVELPGLNHLLQPATTGAPTEYAAIEQTISPGVLELIASWINQRFGAH